jgi:hypothetical protein
MVNNFYQNHQNEQSALTEHNNKLRHMTLEIQVLPCSRHTNMAGFNRLCIYIRLLFILFETHAQV